MTLRRLSVRTRVAALSAASSLVLLAVLAVGMYLLLGGALVGQIDASLRNRSAVLLDEFGEELGDPLKAPREFLETELEEELVDEGAGPAQVVRTDGRVLAASGLSQKTPVIATRALARIPPAGAAPATAAHAGERYRVLARPFPTGGVLLLLAEGLDSVASAQRALLGTLLPAGAVVAVLTGVASVVVAGRGLRPLTAMATSAETINAGALTQRLPVPPSNDEIAQLATTINAMLTRLETAIERERTFTADASHELRTPLAILRGEAELARSHVGGRAAERLDSALDEADRLAALIDDLLVLARADADRLDPVTSVDLGELVAATVKRFSVLAARRDVRMSHAGRATVTGDPRGLERGIANLVDNALRHTPDHGHVGVACEVTAEGSRITVTDTGPGVPTDRLDGIFDRFSRTDDARTAGGAGLGLSIVAAVAAAHHGRVRARNRPRGGLEVTMTLGAGRGPHSRVVGSGRRGGTADRV